jgi:hypothetical protein
VQHTVEFVADYWLDVEGGAQPRVLLKQGTRCKVRLRPRVISDPKKGLMEVADLFFEDGGAARNVPFGCFRFAE